MYVVTTEILKQCLVIIIPVKYLCMIFKHGMASLVPMTGVQDNVEDILCLEQLEVAFNNVISVMYTNIGPFSMMRTRSTGTSWHWNQGTI